MHVRLLATAALGIALGLSACSSDPGADVATSAPASSSEQGVGDAGTALEALTTYADDWSIELTDDQIECVTGNLDEELRSSGGSLSEVAIPFFLAGCGADVSGASGGDGRSPLEAIVASLLIDEDVVLTPDIVTCATEALVDGFGADRFVELLFSPGEPTPDDDAIAEAAFDSCGLDGAAIVGG